MDDMSDRSPTGRVSQAQIGVYFKEWVIPHIRAENAMRIMNELREACRLSKRGTEASSAYILAPSQSGKSHAVTHAYNKRFLIPECRASNWCTDEMTDEQVIEKQEKVLYVKLPSKPELGALVTTLLTAIGDLKPTTGTIPERLLRFTKQFVNGGWELLILDSFDHLTKPGMLKAAAATETQDAIKTMIEEGIPMLFVGLPSAKKGVLNEFQVGVRSQEIPFHPVDLECEVELQDFEEFLDCLDMFMVDVGIFSGSNELAKNYLDVLHLSCQGRLGLVADVVRDAAKRASLRGSDRIEEEDFEFSVHKNVVMLNLSKDNVFKAAREMREEKHPETKKKAFSPFDIAFANMSPKGKAA